MIFISHKLDEVLAVSDDITVIRQGTTVAEVKPGDVNRAKLGELMVGSELPAPEPRHTPISETILVETVGVTVPAAKGPSGASVVSDRMLPDVNVGPTVTPASQGRRPRHERVASACTQARSSASPGSRATASSSSARPSSGSRTATAGTVMFEGRDITHASHP